MSHNKDSIQKFLFEQQDVRGEIVHLDDSFNTIMTQHQYPPYIRQILGETLLATIMMANTIKFEGQLTTQFQADGALKTIVAKCNHKNHIRGFVEWDENAEPTTLAKNLGNGHLVITIETTGQKPYQSIVPIQQRSITQALEYYFAQAEQLSTRLWCAIGETSIAGMLLQLIPSNEGSSTDLQRELFWEQATKLSETITDPELLDLDNSEILHRLFHEDDVRLFKQKNISHKCTCSVERMQNALRMLGEEEAYTMLTTNHTIDIKCEYCSSAYSFDKNDVKDLFS